MYVLFRGPSVEKTSKWRDWSNPFHKDQSFFWSGDGAVSFLSQEFVAEDSKKDQPGEQSDTEPKVGESRGTWLEAVGPFKDGGEGREEQEYEPKDNSIVQRKEEHDGGEQNHFCWAHNALAKDLGRCVMRCRFGDKLVISCRSNQTAGLSPKQHGCVCFSHEKGQKGKNPGLGSSNQD